jgi:triphosphoribosyl-dephospho-CoA synthase
MMIPTLCPGGLEGLNYVQQEAQKLLWQGGVLVEGGIEAMQQLDDELIARNLSPVAVLIYWQ